MRPTTRREALRAGALSGAGLAAALLDPAAVIERALAAAAPAGASLGDIEHVVILMQENRSFDHYFGAAYGVRGFGDPGALRDASGRSVFDQMDPDTVDNPSGHLLPWHLDTAATAAQCLPDITHEWSTQQASYNGGRLDRFMFAHRTQDAGGTQVSPGCMGYFERADLPFHYALADAFTICDAWFCSVLGPTNPNRVLALGGTIDPEGRMGGPVVDNNQARSQLRWVSYPERLQQAGISWFVYQEADNNQNNMLPYFAGFADTSTNLYRRGNTVIPTPAGAAYGPALVARLRADVVSGALPQVSWILASTACCEHPASAPAVGARFTASVLDALTADPEVWARTLLILTYDENGGFFDHVPPPTAPPGTAGEYLSQAAAGTPIPADPGLPGATRGQGGPVGLGFRVPAILISPFTTGGLVCSDVFDHTSILRFLETRFGVPVPNLSAWRRSVAGDLTSALNLAAAPQRRMPSLPDAGALERAAAAACKSGPAARPPAAQVLPGQERGVRARPSGAGAARGGSPARGSAGAPTITLRGVPRRVRRRFRLHVAVAHPGPLRSVEVRVDGRRLLLTHRARFTVTVAPSRLHRGANRLTVVAIDRDGGRARRSVRLTK